MATAGLMKNWVLILLLILLPVFSHFPCRTDAYYADFPSANTSVSWKNTPSNEQGSVDFDDGSTLRPILLVYNITKSYSPFGLGFYTIRTSTAIPDSGFYLVVFMMTGLTVTANNSDGQYQFSPHMPPKVLWSANRDSPVGENAALDFSAEGDLVLRDEFGNCGGLFAGMSPLNLFEWNRQWSEQCASGLPPWLAGGRHLHTLTTSLVPSPDGGGPGRHSDDKVSHRSEGMTKILEREVEL